MAYDILPYPNITAKDPEDQLTQINNYLIQLKESLEFVLTNISADNLSPDLVQKLNDLGSDIKTTAQEQDDQIQNIAHKSLTVSDVINSEAFKTVMKSVYAKIPVKYLASISEKVGDTKTTYTFTDESDKTVTITVPNA